MSNCDCDMMAVEEKHGVYTTLHVIRMPESRNDFNRQYRSINAFKHRCQKRFSKHVEKQGYTTPAALRYDVSMLDHFYERQALEVSMGIDLYGSLPTIEHASPLEFYRYIGYDHTKDRFGPSQANLTEQDDAVNAPASKNMKQALPVGLGEHPE